MEANPPMLWWEELKKCNYGTHCACGTMHMDNVFLLAHTEWGTRLDISLQCTVADCQWPSTLSLLSPCTVSAWHRRWPEEREQTVSSAKATTLTLYYNKLGLKAIWTWWFDQWGSQAGIQWGTYPWTLRKSSYKHSMPMWCPSDVLTTPLWLPHSMVGNFHEGLIFASFMSVALMAITSYPGNRNAT